MAATITIESKPIMEMLAAMAESFSNTLSEQAENILRSVFLWWNAAKLSLDERAAAGSGIARSGPVHTCSNSIEEQIHERTTRR